MVQYAYPPLQIGTQANENVRGFLKAVVLLLIAAAAVSSREFAVVRFESIIHE